MAYVSNGVYTNIEDNNAAYDEERIIKIELTVTTSGKGIYAVGELTEMRPFFGVEWTTYTISTVKSVDSTDTLNWRFINTNPIGPTDVTGESKGEFNFGDRFGLTGYKRAIGTKTFTNPNKPEKYIIINGKSSFPIFKKGDTASINAYIQSGDISGALNKREMLGSKCTIYITNNGDRIDFNTQPNKEDAEDLLYTHIEVAIGDTSGIFTAHKFNIPVVGKYTTSWEGQASLGITSTLFMKITIFDSDLAVATFKDIKMTKKFLGVIGTVAVNPANGEIDGYRYESSTNNSFDEIGEVSEDSADSTDNPKDGSDFGGFSNLCATYQISKQALSDLGNFIWNNSIFDDIKNLNNSPLENIVSLMYMPVSIGGEEHNIVLGNIKTNVSGSLCNQNMKKITVATFNIPYYNSGFLNFEPYTSVDLYLPLVGMVGLQPKDVVGYTVTIQYAFDVVVGSFGVFVYTSKGGGKTLIYSTQGTCAITIPLTASNQAQVQASILSSGVDLISSVASDNVMGAINSASEIATVQNHSSSFGAPSSMIGALAPDKCYYIVRTPIISLPNLFAHTHGFLTMGTYVLNQLSGYTEIERIDLSGIDLLSDELSELESILTSGFYI